MAGEARQEVVELGQLHLDLGGAGAGVEREDIEDQGAAIEDSHVGDLLEIPHLRRRQIVVEDDHVGGGGFRPRLELGGLALTDVTAGVDLPAGLQHAARLGNSGGAGEATELVERFLRLPGRGAGEGDTHQQCELLLLLGLLLVPVLELGGLEQ